MQYGWPLNQIAANQTVRTSINPKDSNSNLRRKKVNKKCIRHLSRRTTYSQRTWSKKIIQICLWLLWQTFLQIYVNSCGVCLKLMEDHIFLVTGLLELMRFLVTVRNNNNFIFLFITFVVRSNFAIKFILVLR